MAGVKIVGAGCALPEHRVTNEALCESLDTDNEWIVSRTGIRSRYIARGEENAASLAVSAAKRAMEAAEKNDPAFSKERITAVLTATMTSDDVFPSVSCVLQKALSLPQEITAFDISAACTGFVYALQTANALLAQDCGADEAADSPYVLVVGSECMSRVLDFTDRSSCILFGDGAGAVVLKRNPSPDGIFLTCAKTSGNSEDLYCTKVPAGDGFLHMNGQKVYRFATTSLRGAMENLMDRAGMTLAEIDYVVCHQANARIIDSVRRHYPGFEDRFFMNLEHVANTSAASVAIALADLFGQGKLREGMRILAVAFGAGLSCSGILMTI